LANVAAKIARETTTTQSSDLFDCQAALANAALAWSEDKISWCCRRKGLGCRPTEAVPIISLPREEHVYNCDAALANFATEWSEGKKVYCCAHESKGCPPVPSPSPFYQAASWQEESSGHGFGFYAMIFVACGFPVGFFCCRDSGARSMAGRTGIQRYGRGIYDQLPLG